MRVMIIYLSVMLINYTIDPDADVWLCYNPGDFLNVLELLMFVISWWLELEVIFFWMVEAVDEWRFFAG